MGDFVVVGSPIALIKYLYWKNLAYPKHEYNIIDGVFCPSYITEKDFKNFWTKLDLCKKANHDWGLEIHSHDMIRH